MTGYTKLFGSIVASTIWREPHETRIVWITMLALANKSGIVEASIPGLADLARVTIEECKGALLALESPDEYSRTKEHDGRRIKPIDGGWTVLNHAKYRAKMNNDERREYLAQKQREHRASLKPVNTVSTRVNKRNGASTPSTQSESDAEAFQPPSRGVSEGNGSDRFPTTDQSKRIASLFHRKLTTAWDEKEVVAYRKIGTVSEDDLTAIERYYKSERAKGEKGFHRRDLGTFLNNFAGELDRARAYRPFTGVTKNTIDDGRWRQFLKSLGREYEEPMRVMPFLRDDFAKWEKLQ